MKWTIKSMITPLIAEADPFVGIVDSLSRMFKDRDGTDVTGARVVFKA